MVGFEANISQQGECLFVAALTFLRVWRINVQTHVLKWRHADVKNYRKLPPDCST